MWSVQLGLLSLGESLFLLVFVSLLLLRSLFFPYVFLSFFSVFPFSFFGVSHLMGSSSLFLVLVHLVRRR